MMPYLHAPGLHSSIVFARELSPPFSLSWGRPELDLPWSGSVLVRQVFPAVVQQPAFDRIPPWHGLQLLCWAVTA